MTNLVILLICIALAVLAYMFITFSYDTELVFDGLGYVTTIVDERVMNSTVKLSMEISPATMGLIFSYGSGGSKQEPTFSSLFCRVDRTMRVEVTRLSGTRQDNIESDVALSTVHLRENLWNTVSLEIVAGKDADKWLLTVNDSVVEKVTPKRNVMKGYDLSLGGLPEFKSSAYWKGMLKNLKINGIRPSDYTIYQA
jgi:hypothetical protein